MRRIVVSVLAAIMVVMGLGVNPASAADASRPSCQWIWKPYPTRNCDGQKLWDRANSEIRSSNDIARWTATLFPDAMKRKSGNDYANLISGLSNAGPYRQCHKNAVLASIRREAGNAAMLSGVNANLDLANRTMKKLKPYGSLVSVYLKIAQGMLAPNSGLRIYNTNASFYAAELISC